VILLSSMKRMMHQWRTCQFWCSLATDSVKDPNKTKLKTDQSGIISREQLFMATICKIIPFLGVVLLLPL